MELFELQAKIADLEQQIADLRNGRPRRKLHEGLKIHAAVLLPIG